MVVSERVSKGAGALPLAEHLLLLLRTMPIDGDSDVQHYLRQRERAQSPE